MRKRTTIRIVRATLIGIAALGAGAWLSASLMAGGQAIGKSPHQMPMPSNGKMTKEQKIANAMTAAHTRPTKLRRSPASASDT
jgi:hypothetical protein